MTGMQELRDRLVEVNEQTAALFVKVDEDKRQLNDEERTELDERLAEFDRLTAEIKQRERFMEQEKLLTTAGENRKTKADPPGTINHPDGDVQETQAADTRSVGNRKLSFAEPARAKGKDYGRWGWRSMGEFAASVKLASARGGAIDKRLVETQAPTTVGNEGVGADGGFAVPPDFRNEIMERIGGEDSLLGRTDQLVSSSNQITVPQDETTAWQSSGGMLTFWENENTQKTQSKPLLQNVNVRLHKLTALVPVTDELLEDAPAMTMYLRRKVPQKIDFAVNLAIVQGSGAGQPLGLLNSGALVTVAKQGSQTADTVVYDNVLKMYNRLYGPYRAGAVWLINQDVEPQLHKMSFEGTSSSVPAWLPAGGVSGAPFDTLFGKPIIPTQACDQLGDLGDILFVNLGEYMTVTKTGGVRAETSIHLWFDYDTTAFRFILRIAGQPWLSSAISPRDGSNTYSAFVALAERA